MKWIIKKIINFALSTKWMYFMFFKYKRNAYFIIKQHELLVAVRAGFMHYSLLKIFINSKIVWWCSCPSATLSPRGSEGISNPKLVCHMVFLAVELWEIPAPHPVTASDTLTCSLQRGQLNMAKPWLQAVFLQAYQSSPDIKNCCRSIWHHQSIPRFNPQAGSLPENCSARVHWPTSFYYPLSVSA